MRLRVPILLLAIVAVACAQTGTNCTGTNQVGENQVVTKPKPNLLQTVKNGLVVIRDLLYIIFGKVNTLRYLLTLASELTVSLFPPDPLPLPLPEPWWGDRPASDTSITPFRLNWSDEMIADLRWRIQNRREITPSLRGAANTYGTNSDFLAFCLDYWANEYDFKARENLLNRFPQFTTSIQGLRIHFIHMKSPNPRGKKVLPLLMLHGWPACAFDYGHLMEELLDEREDCDFVFDMVAPHLPGFGYSEATNMKGMSSYQMGIIMKNLMERLGFSQFYTHGHGLGQVVVEKMAILFPDRVLGMHTPYAVSLCPQTMVKTILGQLYPPAVVEPQYEHKMYPLAEKMIFLIENAGYLHMHASRPDNVGHGIVDSPVAMLSWILELMIVGSEAKNIHLDDGNLTQIFDIEIGFDVFTTSWDSHSLATSIRSYAEFLGIIQDPLIKTLSRTPTPVPLAVIHFKEELLYQPDDFIRDKYSNLVHVTHKNFGGHTAPVVYPWVVAEDLWPAVKKIEQFRAARGLH